MPHMKKFRMRLATVAFLLLCPASALFAQKFDVKIVDPKGQRNRLLIRGAQLFQFTLRLNSDLQ
jgi:hypothetical protein